MCILVAVLLATTALAGIEIHDDQSSGLKKIVVTHWLSRETGPKDNPFRSTTEQITVRVEQDGTPILIIPVSMNALSKKNEITAVAWVSQDLLPSVRISVSGFGASINAEGQSIEIYRYVKARNAFELMKPKTPTDDGK